MPIDNANKIGGNYTMDKVYTKEQLQKAYQEGWQDGFKDGYEDGYKSALIDSCLKGEPKHD